MVSGSRSVLFAVFFSVFTLFFLSRAFSTEDEKSSDITEPSGAERTLPSSFRGISLGMDIDVVKENLVADGIFGYRGERDVSLIPGGYQRNLIETTGTSYISHSWFQFYEGILYNMTFALDAEKIDYFSMFSSLTEKYGGPDTVDPSKAVWSSGNLRLSLERPLTVKYIDLTVFNSIINTEKDIRTQENIQRDDFVSEF